MLDSAYLAAMAGCKPRACGRESCRELLGKQSQTLEQSEPTVPCLQRTVVVVVVMVPRPTYVDGLDTRDLPTAKRGYIILVGSNERAENAANRKGQRSWIIHTRWFHRVGLT